MVKAVANGEASGGAAPAPINKPVCGIVMPISSIDGCSEAHWAEVLDIMRAAAESAGFEANLVSTAEDVGIIQKRIIQNLHDNPIVVCDVSGRNPNVMFELGMRLAFDKPTIIVKDDKTSYAFDTAPIEHLEYPRDLRFSKIVDFRQKLADKIEATHRKATSDSKYTTFLKHFGEFKVAVLDTKEVSGQELILEEIREMRSVVRGLALRMKYAGKAASSRYPVQLAFRANDLSTDDREELFEYLTSEQVPHDVRKGPEGHMILGISDAKQASTVLSWFALKNIKAWRWHELDTLS